MVEARTFRGPVWWWAAGVLLVALALLGAVSEVLIGVVLGLGVLGGLFLLLAARARSSSTVTASPSVPTGSARSARRGPTSAERRATASSSATGW